MLEEARWRLGDRLLTYVAGNVLAGDDVLALQQRLLDLGFKVGKLDGRFGHQTEQAVRDFQRNVGVPAGRHLRARPPSRRCPGSPRSCAAAAPTRCAPRSGSAATARS